MHENEFENVVCKMAVILFRPQCYDVGRNAMMLLCTKKYTITLYTRYGSIL